LGEDPYAAPSFATSSSDSSLVQEKKSENVEEYNEITTYTLDVDDGDDDYDAYLESQRMKTLGGFLDRTSITRNSQLSSFLPNVFGVATGKKGSDDEDDDENDDRNHPDGDTTIFTDGFYPTDQGLLDATSTTASSPAIIESKDFADFATSFDHVVDDDSPELNTQFSKCALVSLLGEGEDDLGRAVNNKNNDKDDPFHSTTATTMDISSFTNKNDNNIRFDIIIIGMQEATFETEQQVDPDDQLDMFGREEDEISLKSGTISDTDSVEGESATFPTSPTSASGSPNKTPNNPTTPIKEQKRKGTKTNKSNASKGDAGTTSTTAKTPSAPSLNRAASGGASASSATATTAPSMTRATSGGGEKSGKMGGLTGKLFKTADMVLTSRSAISATKGKVVARSALLKCYFS
jgi:hypothetical protein